MSSRRRSCRAWRSRSPRSSSSSSSTRRSTHLFISKERAGIIKKKNVQGAPDLVIEILSKSTRRRDERLKLERYDRFGVLEYWMFDPDRKGTKVDSGRLLLVAELSDRDVLTTPLLPGLEIPLAEIFE